MSNSPAGELSKNQADACESAKPCDDCEHANKCFSESLACADYSVWVNQGAYRNASRNPNKNWYNRLFPNA